MTTSLTTDGAIAALARVVDPAFDKPMLEIGTLQDVRVEEGVVHMKAVIAAPSDALRDRITEQVRKALPGVEPKIAFEVQVPTRQQLGDDPIPGVKNVVLVMSGKGGVGKSSAAANLSLALSRGGARVGLLDADIYGPSIPTMFGISGHPSSKDGVKISPMERFGLKLMSIGFLLENDKQAVVWRGPMLHGALNQFLKDVDWGALDYLLVDLPPGTGDVALTIAQRIRSTGAVVVTTPQEVALQDVYKSVSMCQKLQISILGVIENMSWFVDSAGVKHELFGAGGGAKIAEFAQAPLIAQVPLDTRVREWGDKGTPVVQAAPDSPAAEAFTAAAHELATRIAVAHFLRDGGTRLPPGGGPTRLKIVR